MTAPPRTDVRTASGQEPDASLLLLLVGLTVVELGWLGALAYTLYRVLT
jgi:hypothetical protein